MANAFAERCEIQQGLYCKDFLIYQERIDFYLQNGLGKEIIVYGVEAYPYYSNDEMPCKTGQIEVPIKNGATTKITLSKSNDSGPCSLYTGESLRKYDLNISYSYSNASEIKVSRGQYLGHNEVYRQWENKIGQALNAIIWALLTTPIFFILVVMAARKNKKISYFAAVAAISLTMLMVCCAVYVDGEGLLNYHDASYYSQTAQGMLVILVATTCPLWIDTPRLTNEKKKWFNLWRILGLILTCAVVFFILTSFLGPCCF
ncbi:MAG: hypothetical protein V1702_01355 [Candidatus Woesearchaeota archaeon]